ncbi:hypothetical protein [Paraflavitalea sp. CAU 1676]|uniref:hypothetical protein n=1 Tax=Paraflavitalea sp. CAU 1676 TaxID=3032598 RepID=UPI0023DB144C|nr:hypothetical protein [Paraflavitalea sp. CAU 1676]MDF2188133.1 hypothetical protein [Paraflavitalea sp. CAU 1676]
MKRSLPAVLLTAFFVVVLSCGSNTRITGSWIDPDIKGHVEENASVFIASLSRNMEVRTKLENALAAQAAMRNIKVVKSTEFFAPTFYEKLPPREEVLDKIKQTGVDAVLTVSLINKESETRYVPGNNRYYAPYPNYRWYGGLYTYYNYWYPNLWDPGYYTTDKTYFMETNLYDASNEKLLWSAQSETVNPGSIDNFVRDYPKKLVEQLVKDGLLKK